MLRPVGLVVTCCWVAAVYRLVAVLPLTVTVSVCVCRLKRSLGSLRVALRDGVVVLSTGVALTHSVHVVVGVEVQRALGIEVSTTAQP